MACPRWCEGAGHGHRARACSETPRRAANGLLEWAARRKAQQYRSVLRAFATKQTRFKRPFDAWRGVSEQALNICDE